MSATLNSCSVFGGETIGLSAAYKGIYDIYHVALFDENNVAWGFNQYDKRSDWDVRPYTFPIFGGNEYTPDNQKRLPNKARLMWLSAPHDSEFTPEDKAKMASVAYPPERVLLAREQMMGPFKHPHPNPPKVYGPFELDIRSQIPSVVLRKIKGSWTHGLGVTVEFTENYHTMNWALFDRQQPPPGQVRGGPICVGGELPIMQGQKILNWTSGSSRFSAPIWPHCDL